MIQGKSIAERQNDREALLLLKASYRCLRNERVIKYIMIFLSFAICIVAIFNRYLDYIFSSIANISELRDKIAIYINLISGGIIVAGIPLGFYTGRMHSEGTTLMDRYEAYVFDNEANSSILKPVSQTYITMYAKEIKKANSKFKNHIYPDGKVGNEHEAQYEFIKNQAYFDYGLYLYIQPFFYTIWIGFCILIMIMAVSFNDKFIPTLVNILIPSLSAITTIGVSWHSLHLQMKQLTNLINCIDRIEGMSATQKKLYISDKKNIRLLADGLYNYRSSAFVIPGFLETSFHKAQIKQRTSDAEKPETEPQSKSPAKTAVKTPVKTATSTAKPTTTSKPATAAKTTSATKSHPVSSTKSTTATHSKTTKK